MIRLDRALHAYAKTPANGVRHVAALRSDRLRDDLVAIGDGPRFFAPRLDLLGPHLIPRTFIGQLKGFTRSAAQICRFERHPVSAPLNLVHQIIQLS